MELQKVLTVERMRRENLKHNYTALQAEYTSLQNMLTQKQVELKQLLSVKLSHQENLEFLLSELQDSTRGVEELQRKIMNPQWLELLRAQLQQEMKGPVREHFNKLEEEMQKYRAEYNKLHFEYISLKSQFDHNIEESERVLNERKIHFDAEISYLERDKEDLVARYKCFDPSHDKKRVEALLKERVQLHMRGLEVEAGELCGQRDNKGQQVENMQRNHVRQMAESQLTVKSLEAERQSMRLPLERMERELQHSHKQNTQLTGRLHKAEREVYSLTCQVESMKHTHIKLQCARSKGESERNTLQMQIDGLQSDVEVLKGTVKRQQEMLAEKDRELLHKVQVSHEEQFNQTWLENCLAEKEQQRVMQRAQLGEKSAHKEVLSLKTKLQQHHSHLKDLERQKAEIDQLKQHNHKLGVQLGTLSRSQSDLVETNKHLRERLDSIREELRTTKVEAEKSQHEAEKLVEDHRVEWLEEEHKVQQKVAELQNKYSKANDRLQRAIQALKKQETHRENEKSQHEPEKLVEDHCVEWLEEKHKLQQRVSELQNKYSKATDKLQRAAQAHIKRETHKEKEKRLQAKIQLLEAKIAELEMEAKAAERRASYSEDQFNSQRKDLQRRHSEFQCLLFGNQIPAGQSPAFMASSPAPLLIPGSEGPFSNILEDQGQKLLVHHRLEDLGANSSS